MNLERSLSGPIEIIFRDSAEGAEKNHEKPESE
jgi:hypothetical protein